VENLGKLFDERQQLQFATLGEQREGNTNGFAGLQLRNGSLNAHRQLPDTEGHLDMLGLAKTMAGSEQNPAAAEAQVLDLSDGSQACGQASDFGFTVALETTMPPAIFGLLRHACPSRQRSENVIGESRRARESGDAPTRTSHIRTVLNGNLVTGDTSVGPCSGVLCFHGIGGRRALVDQR
jgi:hypothetical protein